MANKDQLKKLKGTGTKPCKNQWLKFRIEKKNTAVRDNFC
jgi:hypothetical protein